MSKKILFLIFFIFSACQAADYSNIKVINVIDGDTVRLSNGKSLRYIGIDTPEVHIRKNGKFVYAPQEFANQAMEFNRRLVEGKQIRIEFDVVKKDKYGRLLGYCFVDGKFVNAELIKEGFALLYTFPPNVKYVDTFKVYQAQARKKLKGLWQTHEVINSDRAYKYIGKVRSVQGRVLSTYQSKKCVYLNFGTNYKTDFTVVIFSNVIKYFKDKNIDPVSFYKGKTIRVCGKIKEYNGPEIIINMPQEIEVLSQ